MCTCITLERGLAHGFKRLGKTVMEDDILHPNPNLMHQFITYRSTVNHRFRRKHWGGAREMIHAPLTEIIYKSGHRVE